MINRYVIICLDTCSGSSAKESDTFPRESCNFFEGYNFMVLKRRSFVIVMIPLPFGFKQHVINEKKGSFFFKKSQLCGKKFRV